MKKKNILLLLAIMMSCTFMLAQELNLQQINSGYFAAKQVKPVVSSADGMSYYQANNEKTQIIKYDFKTGKPLQVIFDVTKARETKLKNFQAFIVSPDENRIIIIDEIERIYRRSSRAVLYNYDIRRNYLSRITDKSSKQSSPKFSPDGRMLTYVADNNIWLVKFDYDTESRITSDGKVNEIINANTDWVYEEEFATTSIIDFSTDGNLIAFVKFNESKVKEYSIEYYNNKLYKEIYTYKYPKTGEENSVVTVVIFDVEAKTLREVKLPSYIEYIPRIEFFQNSNNLAVFTLNREQNKFEIFSVNARSLVPKQIYEETNQKYVDSEIFMKTIFFDDHMLIPSEKDGFTHLYLYTSKGEFLKQLTSGNYDVSDILSYNTQRKEIYYQASAISPLEREIYKINYLKGNVTKLSKERGFNRANFSNNGNYYINFYSSFDKPDFITLHDNTGKELSVLEDNKELQNKLARFDLPKKEFTTFKSADNAYNLNAYILKPSHFSPSKKYPVVMIQYSGPGSQLVLDKYSFDWQQYLVEQGYIVVCVDGRGTGSRGEVFKKLTYRHLGVLESEDQVAVAKQLQQIPYIDGANIGIWGWSYGGYNTLMSVSAPSNASSAIKAGVAIAPVTDWRFYDTIYGERYMNMPQQNPDGYKVSSAINRLGDLNGNILIIHGTADDNVHVQNTMEYLTGSIANNKDVDLFLFPDKDHSIAGVNDRTYLYNKVIKFFDKHLKNK